MTEFGAFDTAIIIAMVVGYILFTSWLTVRLRSRTSDQFMTAARALPPAVVGVLLMYGRKRYHPTGSWTRCATRPADHRA